MYFEPNQQLPEDVLKYISSFLDFSGDSYTALDMISKEGLSLNQITSSLKKVRKYAVTSSDSSYWDNRYYQQAKEDYDYEKVCPAHYKNEHKITNNVFSIAYLNPEIHYALHSDIFTTLDPYLVPDFEKEEKARLEAELKQKNYLDFDEIELTQEQKTQYKEDFEKLLANAMEERRKQFYKDLREQEKRLEMYRDDRLLLSMYTRFLAKNGILIFVTPKEFLDPKICSRLATYYDQISIHRLPEEHYKEQRKCIIIARKTGQVQKNEQLYSKLIKFQTIIPYQQIPVLKNKEEPLYKMPVSFPKSVELFRVGQLTSEEASYLLNKSNGLDKFIKQYYNRAQEEKPKPSTHLRKGTLSLCLASGLLNGYIGTGHDAHLVKGSVMKMPGKLIQEEDEETGQIVTKETEYFNIGIKYLDRYGNFVRLL